MADVIRGYRYRYGSEADLQAGLAEALANAGHSVVREAIVEHGRIDLLVDGHVGVEVKVAGPTSAVRRQLARYARSERIDALVLVTSRTRHVLPERIEGVPVTVVNLAGAGL